MNLDSRKRNDPKNQEEYKKREEKWRHGRGGKKNEHETNRSKEPNERVGPPAIRAPRRQGGQKNQGGAYEVNIAAEHLVRDRIQTRH